MRFKAKFIDIDGKELGTIFSAINWQRAVATLFNEFDATDIIKIERVDK